MANLFDALNAPTGVPEQITVGDFLQFKVSAFSEDYSNSLHTMRLVAQQAKSAGAEIKVDAVTSGDDYLFTVASATTQAFTSGNYVYQLEIERNSDNERLIVETGFIEVVPDLDVDADTRSHAETMVDKIEGILIGKADSDVSSYSIAGRSLTKLSPQELLEWRDYYRRELASERRKEDIKNSRKGKNTILLRF